MSKFFIRPLNESDSLEELTKLLHRAYKPLGDAGMNFTAVDQSVEKTRERASLGVCFVACLNVGEIVGTVSCHNKEQGVSKTWYRRKSV